MFLFSITLLSGNLWWICVSACIFKTISSLKIEFFEVACGEMLLCLHCLMCFHLSCDFDSFMHQFLCLCQSDTCILSLYLLHQHHYTGQSRSVLCMTMPEHPLANMEVHESWWLTQYSNFFNKCVWSGHRALQGSPLTWHRHTDSVPAAFW